MSFSPTCKPFQKFDKDIVFGDTFTFEVWFPFDITGYDFVFDAVEFQGQIPPIISFDDIGDYTVVAGDPTVVQNSVLFTIDSSVTALYDFKCLYYTWQWVAPSGSKKTFIAGIIRKFD